MIGIFRANYMIAVISPVFVVVPPARSPKECTLYSPSGMGYSTCTVSSAMRKNLRIPAWVMGLQLVGGGFFRYPLVVACISRAHAGISLGLFNKGVSTTYPNTAIILQYSKLLAGCAYYG